VIATTRLDNGVNMLIPQEGKKLSSQPSPLKHDLGRGPPESRRDLVTIVCLFLVSPFRFFLELASALFELFDNVILFEGGRAAECLAYPSREGSMREAEVTLYISLFLKAT